MAESSDLGAWSWDSGNVSRCPFVTLVMPQCPLLHKYYSVRLFAAGSLDEASHQNLSKTTGNGDHFLETQLSDLEKHQAARNEVNWITAIFMAIFHVGAIAAFFFFTWKAFFVAILLWWISGSLGIGMSYHRLLTHRGYKTY